MNCGEYAAQLEFRWEKLREELKKREWMVLMGIEVLQLMEEVEQGE